MDLITILIILVLIVIGFFALLIFLGKMTFSKNKKKSKNYSYIVVVFICSIIISLITIKIIAPPFILFSGPLIANIVSDSTSTNTALPENGFTLIEYEEKDSVAENIAYQRNQFLVNSLQLHQSTVATFEKVAIDNKNQVRLYYMMILAAIITIIRLKDIRRYVLISTIIIIPLMYGIFPKRI